MIIYITVMLLSKLCQLMSIWNVTESTNTFHRFVSMDPTIGWGRVMDLKEFSDTFGSEGLYEQLPPLLKFP